MSKHAAMSLRILFLGLNRFVADSNFTQILQLHRLSAGAQDSSGMDPIRKGKKS